MKKQSFIIGALILTIGGFIAKVIGAFYKIPLTNILGSNGMGLYYLIFPIYSIFFVFSSSGISMALTRCVAGQRLKKNKKNESLYFKCSLLLSFAISVLFTTILIFCSKPIAYAQGNINAYMGYIVIAPALICATIISVIKGYFQGIENMIPSSIALIFEQIVKLSLGLYFSTKYIYKGVQYGVLGAIIGVSVSEAITLVIMCINYLWYKHREDYKFFVLDVKEEKIIRVEFKQKLAAKKIYRKTKVKKRKKPTQKLKILHFVKDENFLTKKQALINLIKFSLPVSLSSLILPLTSFIDSFMIINLLIADGFTTTTATSLYGISNGVVSSLISLPVIVTTALSTAIVPNLSGLVIHKSKQEVADRSGFYIKLTWIITLPMVLVLTLLAPEIISFLYQNGLNNAVLDEFAFAVKLLLISGVGVVYNCFLSTFISILNATNKPYVPFAILSFGCIIRTIMCFLLVRIPKVNVFGSVISNIVFLAISCIMCIYAIKRNLNISYKLDKGFFRPLLCALLTGLVMYGTKILLKPYVKNWVLIGICGVICLIVYMLLIFVINCFTKYEMQYLPNKKLFKKQKKMYKR